MLSSQDLKLLHATVRAGRIKIREGVRLKLAEEIPRRLVDTAWCGSTTNLCRRCICRYPSDAIPRHVKRRSELDYWLLERPKPRLCGPAMSDGVHAELWEECLGRETQRRPMVTRDQCSKEDVSNL